MLIVNSKDCPRTLKKPMLLTIYCTGRRGRHDPLSSNPRKHGNEKTKVTVNKIHDIYVTIYLWSPDKKTLLLLFTLHPLSLASLMKINIEILWFYTNDLHVKCHLLQNYF